MKIRVRRLVGGLVLVVVLLFFVVALGSGRTRIGAICKDGSRSSATGSGACSHHGGVAYWLYAAEPSKPVEPVAVKPPVPSTVGATAGGASVIRLEWSDKSDTETGFRIERKPQGGNFAQVATIRASVTMYIDTALMPGTTYCYRVCSYNTEGDSAYSDEACATTAHVSPDLPASAHDSDAQAVSVVPHEAGQRAPLLGVAAAVATTSHIRLRWIDTSNSEIGFRIERKPLGGDFAQVATVGANATTYIDTALRPETTYCYRVSAYDAESDSDYSNEMCATSAGMESESSLLLVSIIGGIALVILALVIAF